MGHNHDHGHNRSIGNIKTAFFLNLIFTIIEIIGGIMTNSLAIISDAIHDLGDSFSLGLSWYFQKVSQKEPNAKFTYGFKRLSLLGAIVNSIILIIGAIFIMREAIPRIISPQETDALGMMWLAMLGILVNGAAALKLRTGSSINERVVSLHLLEDVLGWAAVLVASIVMQFWTIPVLDPILSIAISAFVLFNVFKNIRESMQIILQGIPKNVDLKAIRTTLTGIPKVTDMHDCHIWTMDGEHNILTAHLVTNDPNDISWEEVQRIKSTARSLLHEKFNVEHATIELEPSNGQCRTEEIQDHQI